MATPEVKSSKAMEAMKEDSSAEEKWLALRSAMTEAAEEALGAC